MLELCSQLCVGSAEDPFDFVSTDWLSKCLHEGIGEDGSVGPIDNNSEICPHGRVDPSRVTNMKAISVVAVSTLVFFSFYFFA